LGRKFDCVGLLLTIGINATEIRRIVGDLRVTFNATGERSTVCHTV